MYIIAGLGNPEQKYDHTRHNVGFSVIDVLAQKYGIEMTGHDFKALTGKGRINGQQVLLMKPLTYMNLSGEAIWPAAAFYKIDPATELVVISDDIDLSVGEIRVRAKGSAGGHNGLKNIIAQLGTEQFPRVRVGVGGKPEGGDLVAHVLGKFSKDEEKILEQVREAAADAAVKVLEDGAEAAMNTFNGKKYE